MSESTFEIRDADSPARVVLTGHLDAALVGRLEAAVDAWTPADRPPLVIDLTGVEGYEPEAREALVAVNRAVAAKAGRHAYLARTALMRGLSLWVMHMANDLDGRAVGSDKQVEAWLHGDRGRLENSFRTAGLDTIPDRAQRGGASPRLSFAERIGVQAVGWIHRITMGYWPAFTRELVRTYGLDGLKQWGEAVEAAIKRLSERFGDEIGQGLIAMAAVWNGCAYCTTGHLYALNVLYFKRTGRLFPIDEREVPRWYTMTDERLIARIVERLEGDEFAELRRLIERQYQIRVRGEHIVDGPDDEAIVLANAAWDLVNECSIVIETGHIPPLHPAAARARGVQKAYAQKRGRAAAR